MNTETTECANDMCQCDVTAALAADSLDPTESYCGDYCRDAAIGEEQDTCACGHPKCDVA